MTHTITRAPCIPTCVSFSRLYVSASGGPTCGHAPVHVNGEGVGAQRAAYKRPATMQPLGPLPLPLPGLHACTQPVAVE